MSSRYFDFRLISLPARADRRRACRKQFEAAGIPWADVLVFDAVRPSTAAGFVSIGAHGCFRSHLEALRAAIGTGRPVMICEDDLNLSTDYAGRISEVTAFLESNPWDIFYGGGHTCGQEPVHLAERRHDSHMMHGHMVAFHPRVLPRLVAFLDNMLAKAPDHVDVGYCLFRAQNADVVTRCAMPTLGYQRASMSDIQVRGWHDRVPVLRHLAGPLRVIKNLMRAA